MFHKSAQFDRRLIIGVIIVANLLLSCQPPTTAPNTIASPFPSPADYMNAVTVSPTSLASTATLTPAMAITPTTELISQGTEVPTLVLEKTLDFDGFQFSISPDGNYVAINYPESVSILDLASGDLMADLRKPSAGLMSGGSVAYSPDGSILAAEVNVEGTHGTESSIFLWDTSTHTLLETHAFNGLLVDLEFSADGKLVAATDPAIGRIEVWDIESKTVKSLEAVAPRLAFSPTAPLLASALIVGKQGGTAVLLWGLEDVTHERIFEISEKPDRLNVGEVTSLAFSPDGQALTAVIDGQLRIWDLGAKAEIGGPSTTAAALVQAIYSKSGYLAMLDQTGQIVVYDQQSWTPVGAIALESYVEPGFYAMSFNMVFAPNGDQLVTGGSGLPLQIWQIP